MLTVSRVIGSVAVSLNKTEEGGSSSLTTNSILGSLGVHGAENCGLSALYAWI